MSETVLGTGASGCVEHPDLDAGQLVGHDCADVVQPAEDHTLDAPAEDAGDEG